MQAAAGSEWQWSVGGGGGGVGWLWSRRLGRACDIARALSSAMRMVALAAFTSRAYARGDARAGAGSSGRGMAWAVARALALTFTFWQKGIPRAGGHSPRQCDHQRISSSGGRCDPRGPTLPPPQANKTERVAACYIPISRRPRTVSFSEIKPRTNALSMCFAALDAAASTAAAASPTRPHARGARAPPPTRPLRGPFALGKGSESVHKRHSTARGSPLHRRTDPWTRCRADGGPLDASGLR